MMMKREAQQLRQVGGYRELILPGKTILRDVADKIDYLILDPTIRKIEIGRILKELNPQVEIAAYTTSITGMLAENSISHAQPFRAGELKELIDQYPKFALRSATDQMISKAVGKDQEIIALDPHFDPPLLFEAHNRHLTEAMKGGSDVFNRYFIDRWSTIFDDPQSVPVKGQGDPRGERWFSSFALWAAQQKTLSTIHHLAFSALISSPPEFIPSRYRSLVRTACYDNSFGRGEVAIDKFLVNDQQQLLTEHVKLSIEKAKIVAEYGGRQLFIVPLDPRSANPKGDHYEMARKVIIAAAIVNSGSASIFFSGGGGIFYDVPLIREIGRITGKPEGGIETLRQPREGLIERSFEKAILRFDLVTMEASILDRSEIILNSDPLPPPVAAAAAEKSVTTSIRWDFRITVSEVQFNLSIEGKSRIEEDQPSTGD
jgi:hypothetical protein